MNQAQQSAQVLLEASQALGNAIDLIEQLCRLGQLGDEEAACDDVLINGAEVSSSLRRLAMRLDRAAYLNAVA